MFGSPALLVWLVAAAPPAGPGAGLDSAAPAVSPSCPDAAAVWAGVKALVGARLPPSATPSSVQIEDLGDHYRVSVAGSSRDVVDATRDCPRRAQVATVFVALTLVPPDVPEVPPPEAPAPPPARVALGVEVAATGGFDAVAAGGGAPLVGASARLVVGGPRLSGVAGVGASFGAAQAAGPARVRERRFPVDAGVRLGWQGRRLSAGLDLEAVAAWLAVTPVGGSASGGTLDWGARVAGTVTFGQGRIEPILGIQMEMSASPRSLALEPDGVVSHASWVRVSGLLGLRVELP